MNARSHIQKQGDESTTEVFDEEDDINRGLADGGQSPVHINAVVELPNNRLSQVQRRKGQ